MKNLRSPLAVTLLALAVLGCASPADPGGTPTTATTSVTAKAMTATTAPAKVEPTPQQIGEAALKDGIEQYNKGDFNGTLRVLQGTPELWAGSVETRLQAYKYVAFSYCLSNRRQQCRSAFDEMLKLNPAYELSVAEGGHPMWGPVFAQARRDAKLATKPHVAPASDKKTPTKSSHVQASANR